MSDLDLPTLSVEISGKVLILNASTLVTPEVPVRLANLRWAISWMRTWERYLNERDEAMQIDRARSDRIEERRAQ